MRSRLGHFCLDLTLSPNEPKHKKCNNFASFAPIVEIVTVPESPHTGANDGGVAFVFVSCFAHSFSMCVFSFCKSK